MLVITDAEFEKFADKLQTEIENASIGEIRERLIAIGIDPDSALEDLKGRIDIWGKERGLKITQSTAGIEIGVERGEPIHAPRIGGAIRTKR